MWRQVIYAAVNVEKYTTQKHRIFDSKTYNLKYEIL